MRCEVFIFSLGRVLPRGYAEGVDPVGLDARACSFSCPPSREGGRGASASEGVCWVGLGNLLLLLVCGNGPGTSWPRTWTLGPGKRRTCQHNSWELQSQALTEDIPELIASDYRRGGGSGDVGATFTSIPFKSMCGKVLTGLRKWSRSFFHSF